MTKWVIKKGKKYYTGSSYNTYKGYKHHWSFDISEAKVFSQEQKGNGFADRFRIGKLIEA